MSASSNTHDRRSTGPAAAAAPSGARLIDPATVMRIKNLSVRARVIVDGFLSGIHRSPIHGFSVEFSEYREYTPGDDPRHLDWRLYARSDRYYIKQFEDETNLHCHLVLDLSRSMGYGSGAVQKIEYARTAAATLAYFLTLQRDAVGVLAFDEDVVAYEPARFRPGRLRRLMAALGAPTSGRATDLVKPLDRVSELVHRRGLIVLISDFLAPIESLQVRLGRLRARGHDVLVVRVLDPAEKTFEFSEATMFRDVESDRMMYVDPEAVRGDYVRRFTEHAEQLTRACRELGVDYSEFTTNEPLELLLYDLLQARARRGRDVLRRAPSRGGAA